MENTINYAGLYKVAEEAKLEPAFIKTFEKTLNSISYVNGTGVNDTQRTENLQHRLDQKLKEKGLDQAKLEKFMNTQVFSDPNYSAPNRPVPMLFDKEGGVNRLEWATDKIGHRLTISK